MNLLCCFVIKVIMTLIGMLIWMALSEESLQSSFNEHTKILSCTSVIWKPLPSQKTA